MKDLNITINYFIPNDIYRTLHPIPTEQKFYSSAHGTFTNTDIELSHKTSVIQFQKIELADYPLTATEANQESIKLDT